MDDVNYHPDQKKKNPAKWMIGCGAGLVVMVCVVGFIVIGGFAGLFAIFGGEPAGLSMSVTAPSSQLVVGDTFQISIQLGNTGSQNITISEIQLPNELLAKALITQINPAGVKGVDYGDQTGYKFDMVIAPNGQENIEFGFQALQAGDINGSIDVSVGTKMTTRSLRVVIAGETSQTTIDENQGQTPETGSLLGDVIPYQSVVQIIAVVEMDGQLVEGWSGSGTIISDDGLILTNAHVILSDRYYDVVDLVVAITVAQDEPPQPMFYADVIQADAALDIAVIKVRSDLNGGPANFASLGIPPVPLGSSDSLQLGDEIIIIGYPGIGGETITLTRGEVSGFTPEAPYGNRAFIKTSATIAGGNSGGLAATANGEIIGIPTQVGSGDIDVETVDCRRLVDTNRDGLVDENDNCVPTGGFINALRPIKLALPLIEAARTGQVAIQEDTGGTPNEEYEPEGDMLVGDDFSDNSYEWGLLNDSSGMVDISGGQLKIHVYSDQYFIWSTLAGNYDDLIMVTEAQPIQWVGDGDFGFVCGVQDGSNFTALEITEDGYYSIWKKEYGDTITLVDWAYSDLIAESSTFTLAAYCGQDRLALAVNDVLLAETVDPNYAAGAAGLIAGTYDNPDFIVGFDSYYIFEP